MKKWEEATLCGSALLNYNLTFWKVKGIVLEKVFAEDRSQVNLTYFFGGGGDCGKKYLLYIISVDLHI